MQFGGHVTSLDDLEFLRYHRFDFGEVVLRNEAVREFWRASGVKNGQVRRFGLIAHGPLEGAPNDLDNLWNRYVPALEQTVDAAADLGVEFLTVHLWMDSRFVRRPVVEEKFKALQRLVRYARDRGVAIGLENLSEGAEDLVPVLDAVPELGLTLDIGHGQLLTEKNTAFSIIERSFPAIRHVHVHDNKGGNGVGDDLHLALGRGIIDFPAIIGALVDKGYHGTVTLELDREDLLPSRTRLLDILAMTARSRHVP